MNCFQQSKRLNEVKHGSNSINYWPINNGKNTNNRIHKDGGAPYTIKAMIYLDDVRAENGAFCVSDGTKIVPITGKCGTVAIFKNREVPHCALPVQNGSRKVLMLELIPALAHINTHNVETRPINALHLLNPFMLN